MGVLNVRIWIEIIENWKILSNNLILTFLDQTLKKAISMILFLKNLAFDERYGYTQVKKWKYRSYVSFGKKGGFEKSILLLPKELWKYPIFGHFLPFLSTFGFFREQKTSFLEPQIFCGSFFYQTPP